MRRNDGNPLWDRNQKYRRSSESTGLLSAVFLCPAISEIIEKGTYAKMKRDKSLYIVFKIISLHEIMRLSEERSVEMKDKFNYRNLEVLRNRQVSNSKALFIKKLMEDYDD